MTDRPRFSIVLETENLANASRAGLLDSMTSLVRQTVPLDRACEVLLLETGDSPPEMLDWLQREYPWLNVRFVDGGLDYYAVKMLGAQAATGEIVVYCDCDCHYEPQWLEEILAAFAAPDVQAVAGETMTRDVGPYGTAMALTYIFPQFTDRAEPFPTQQYFLNNVAFRRETLLAVPIPSDLPFFRGNCLLHAYHLRSAGIQIWQQPRARATHAAPESLFYFVWRFMFIGHDMYWFGRYLKNKPAKATPDRPASLKREIIGFFRRIRRLVARKPRHLLYFPLALPIAIASVLLVFLGNRITALKPYYLRTTYLHLLGDTP